MALQTVAFKLIAANPIENIADVTPVQRFLWALIMAGGGGIPGLAYTGDTEFPAHSNNKRVRGRRRKPCGDIQLVSRGFLRSRSHSLFAA